MRNPNKKVWEDCSWKDKGTWWWKKNSNNEKIAIIKFILYSSIFALFSVPALQLLGVLPQSVMKATLSKLVEPQEQGNNQLKIK